MQKLDVGKAVDQNPISLELSQSMYRLISEPAEFHSALNQDKITFKSCSAVLILTRKEVAVIKQMLDQYLEQTTVQRSKFHEKCRSNKLHKKYTVHPSESPHEKILIN